GVREPTRLGGRGGDRVDDRGAGHQRATLRVRRTVEATQLVARGLLDALGDVRGEGAGGAMRTGHRVVAAVDELVVAAEGEGLVVHRRDVESLEGLVAIEVAHQPVRMAAAVERRGTGDNLPQLTPHPRVSARASAVVQAGVVVRARPPVVAVLVALLGAGRRPGLVGEVIVGVDEPGAHHHLGADQLGGLGRCRFAVAATAHALEHALGVIEHLSTAVGRVAGEHHAGDQHRAVGALGDVTGALLGPGELIGAGARRHRPGEPAVAAAAVTGSGIAVIALLVPLDHAVAADRGDRQLAGVAAGVVVDRSE